ncbi:SH3 domain-containing protein [Streptomyces sp. NPDC059629]|uniref:SH3 domain-containing protein n=1 Tax=Streptomyces sp. NPDC059629 TaxID=3346889 RepID=UPI00367CB04B
MRIRRSLLAAIGAAALAVTGFAVPATAATSSPAAFSCGWKPANNFNPPDAKFTQDGVNIRSGQSTSCPALGQGYKSHSLDIRCLTSNDPDTWMYVTDKTTGVTGWVNQIYLIWGAGHSVRQC